MSSFLDEAGLEYFWNKIKAKLLNRWGFERGTNIADGSDLNDITAIGNYYVERGANSATITNTPIASSGYLLKVMTPSPGGEYRMQLAFPNDDNGIFKRYYNTSSGWTDWQEYSAKRERDTINTQFLLSSASSRDVPINYGFGSSAVAMYLISCGRYNVNTDTNSGLYLVKAYNNGSTVHYNVSAIKSASGVTIDCDGTNISITTTVTYMAFSVMQVF